MRPFVIDEAFTAKMSQLRQYAKAHPFSFPDLVRMSKGEIPAVGNDPSHVVNLPFGFRVVLSYEEQPEPLGWCWHLSVSVPDPTRLPNPLTIETILQTLRLPPLCEGHVYPEHLPNVNMHAINVITKAQPETDPITN